MKAIEQQKFERLRGQCKWFLDEATKLYHGVASFVVESSMVYFISLFSVKIVKNIFMLTNMSLKQCYFGVRLSVTTAQGQLILNILHAILWCKTHEQLIFH